MFAQSLTSKRSLAVTFKQFIFGTYTFPGNNAVKRCEITTSVNHVSTASLKVEAA